MQKTSSFPPLPVALSREASGNLAGRDLVGGFARAGRLRSGFRRPVVVVQSDPLNRSRIATVVCVPLTRAYLINASGGRRGSRVGACRGNWPRDTPSG